jgi:hypothetical protein
VPLHDSAQLLQQEGIEQDAGLRSMRQCETFCASGQRPRVF